MAKILLVGCGDIGTKLGIQLTSAGHQCYGLRRNCAQLPATIEPVSADVTDPDSLANLPAGLDFVVYTLTPGSFDETSYRQVYIDGLRNLIHALHLQNQSITRLLFVSSTSMYGQHHGEWVDEYSDASPSGFSGKIMQEAERVAQQSGFASTRIRFSGIYGSGNERLLKWAKEGMSCPANPAYYSNRIHRDDCVGLLSYLIEMNLANRFPEDIYLASDSKPAPYHEILEWLKQRLNVKQSIEQSGESGDLSDKLRGGSKRCSNQRVLTSGYQFLYPDYRQGFEAILQSAENPSND